MYALSPEHASAPHDSAPLVPHDRGRTVVWLRGEHDISNVPSLKEALARAISQDDADVVIDLRRVSLIDAAIIGVLLDGREALRKRSRRFALRSPSARAMRVLAVCGLTDLVEPPPFQPHERTSEP
jgi:anti-anti-sigma factor